MYPNGTKNGRYLFDAQKDEGLRSRLLEQGAVECLVKPFSDTALFDALNAAFRVS